MQLAQLAPARRELARTSQREPPSQRASLLAAQHEALDATYEAERVLEARIRMLQAQMEQFLAEEGGEPGGGDGAFLTDAAAADAAEGAPGVSGGGGGGGGGGEKDAAAAGGVGPLPHSSPPPLRTYSRAGLAALDEVLRRDIWRVVVAAARHLARHWQVVLSWSKSRAFEPRALCGSMVVLTADALWLFDFHTRMRVHPSSGGKGAVWTDWSVLSCEFRASSV